MIDSIKNIVFQVLLLSCAANTQAQTIYLSAVTGQGCQAFALDVQTCEICPIGPADCISMNDMIFLGDGSFASVGTLIFPTVRGVLSIFFPPGFNAGTIEGPTGSNFHGAVNAPNGLVYIFGRMNGQSVLFSYDPVTQQIDVIGNLPVLIQEGYYLGGQLFGYTFVPPNTYNLWQIDTNDPMQSVFIQNIPNWQSVQSVCAVDSLVYVGVSSSKIHEYNPVTNTMTLLCDFTPFYGGADQRLTSLPPGFPVPPCLCTTNAGSVLAIYLQLCPNEDISVLHYGDQVLDADDMLQFILYSDIQNPAGSIIMTSATPVFSFAPPLQTGEQYFISAISGNNVDGNVDLNDPCLSVSNAAVVVWRPLPTVTFSVSNPDVCAGVCTTVTATFTGDAPFTLTYAAPGLSPTTQTFSSNTGTFQVCVPANAPAGGFSVQATALVDTFCTCN